MIYIGPHEDCKSTIKCMSHLAYLELHRLTRQTRPWQLSCIKMGDLDTDAGQ